MIGAATLDRLRHGAHKIVLDGESYRGLKPGVESSRNRACKRRQNQATLIPVRTLQLLVSGGVIKAKTPGAITPKGDTCLAVSDADSATLVACREFSAFCLTVEVSCSIVAAVCSSAAACCSDRSDRWVLSPAASCAAETIVEPVVLAA